MGARFNIGRIVSHSMTTFAIVSKLGLGAFASMVSTAVPAQACGPESYIGTVCAFAFDWCPREWLPADGRTVSINGNQALYSLIGTYYGGSVQSGQFALPDLRGRAIVNAGTGPGLPTQRFAARSGDPMSTLTVANLPLHNHTAVFSGTGGGTQTVNVPASPGTLGVTATLNAKDEVGVVAPGSGSYLGKGPTSGSGSATIYVPSNSTATNVPLGGLSAQLTGTPGNGAFSFTYQSGITGGNVVIGNTGGSASFSNQSPSLAMNYCILVNGYYPDRP